MGQSGYLEQLHMAVWFSAKALAGEAVLVGQRVLDVARLLWRRRQAGALLACLRHKVRQLALQRLHGRPVVPCVQQQLRCVVCVPASRCTVSARTWIMFSAEPHTMPDRPCLGSLWVLKAMGNCTLNSRLLRSSVRSEQWLDDSLQSHG